VKSEGTVWRCLASVGRKEASNADLQTFMKPDNEEPLYTDNKPHELNSVKEWRQPQMQPVKVKLKVSGTNIQVKRLRAKNQTDRAVQTIQLDEEKSGSFLAVPGVPYLITRYVLGSSGQLYTIALDPPQSFVVKVRGPNGSWDGKLPLEAEVWGGGFGLHNNAIRIEEDS
jgi:hypothetical protein